MTSSQEGNEQIMEQIMEQKSGWNEAMRLNFASLTFDLESKVA